MPSNKNLLNFARSIVKDAGGILLGAQRDFKVVNQKDNQDIATSADIASEKYLINKILEKYPDHGIISEEKGEINAQAEYVWVIDPLDGTKEFVRNVPLWNCSLAVMKNGKTIVSVIYRPYEKVMYFAADGFGAFRNNEKLAVSKTTKLSDSFVYCYIPSYKRQKDRYNAAFKALSKIGKKVYRLRAMADENTALCWLAQGGCEAYLNLSNPPKLHDIAPGLLIAKEAGAFNTINKIPLVVTNNKNIYNEIGKIL